jgi:hypothetical protein
MLVNLAPFEMIGVRHVKLNGEVFQPQLTINQKKDLFQSKQKQTLTAFV